MYTTTFIFTCSFSQLFIYLLAGRIHTSHNLYVEIRNKLHELIFSFHHLGSGELNVGCLMATIAFIH